MIDFRYHLVSIIAVFLALAVGIFVGSTALNSAPLAIVSKTASQVSNENHELIQRNRTLAGQVTVDQDLTRAAARRMLSGVLADHSVVLVDAPGADSATIGGVTAAIRAAGGTVTGQVGLTTLFFDTSGSAEDSLTNLAGQYDARSGAGSAGSAVSGQQAAATALAAALVTTASPVPAAVSQARATVSAFAQRGYLQLAGTGVSQLQQAQLAVIVEPASPAGSSDHSLADQAVVALAQALRSASRGVVLAGALAGIRTGSVISALLSGALSAPVSTVDCADTETGQVMTVWALAGQLAGRPAANYGVQTGAIPPEPAAPSAAATPASSPSAKASSSASPSAGASRGSGR